ncbi:MAG: hypothetical protein B6244_10710 [Candidatus Cloacimonetes bacterium 4572_55]|nr:MAG: hypothetical protein B6244_10710 [Candidatus Cloacimonetes bacterium 4572_55]
MILRLSKKRKNFYPIFALIIFVSFALYLPVFAVGQGEISVETNLDKSIITIGDRVHYTLLVTHSPDVLVEMPATGVNLGQFEIQDYQISEPEEIDDMIVESVTYRISVYEVGKFHGALQSPAGLHSPRDAVGRIRDSSGEREAERGRRYSRY